LHFMRVRSLELALTLALVGLFLVACPSDSRWARKYQVVANIGDTTLSRAEFISALLQSGINRLHQKRDRDALGKAVLKGLVEQKLVLIDAKRKGVTVKPALIDHTFRRNAKPFAPADFRETLHLRNMTPQRYREALEQDLLADAYWSLVLAKLPPISDEQVRAQVKRTPTPKLKQTRVRARHILLPTQEEAELVRKQIAHKLISFENAAKRFSKAPEAQRGGDLGWFTKGQMPAFFDTCFALRKSQISDVVPSEYGFHLFWVVDETNAVAESEDVVWAKTRRQLEDEQELRAMKQVLQKLKSNIHVKVHNAAFVHAMDTLALVKPKQGSST
jgi:peptidyl-prolyl cis-trans isomerase C